MRYGRIAMALHWLTALALIAQWIFGYLLDDLAPRGTPLRAGTINLHKSLGIVLGLLLLARLLWRLRAGAPAWPATFSAGQRLAAKAGHAMLYAVMLVLPLAGYLGSNFSKHGIAFFGTRWPAWGPDLPAVYAVLNTVHRGAAWLLALLVLGHVALALKHAWIDRDGSFSRILPARNN